MTLRANGHTEKLLETSLLEKKKEKHIREKKTKWKDIKESFEKLDKIKNVDKVIRSQSELSKKIISEN